VGSTDERAFYNLDFEAHLNGHIKVDVSSPGSSIGTGGMVTKLIAAELASSAGCSTIISIGSDPKRVIRILDEITKNASNPDYEPLEGTYFVAQKRQLEDRKWWIRHGLAPSGSVYVDQGAVKAICGKGSLFAAGIVEVEGTFNSQQCVRILSRNSGENGVVEVARGLTSYSSAEIQRIKGAKSSQIVDILGYCETEEVIHRNNLTLIRPDSG
jgi:glutamate 5-kinase